MGKKPLSGYMLWFKGARSTIKGKNIAEVSKKAGEMWKGLSAEKKKPFADKAQEAKKTYDAYVATSKGAAALKAYKDAISKARGPLTKNSDAAKAMKAAAKVKAKAKREKAKAKAAAKKAAMKTAMKKAKAMKAPMKAAMKTTKKVVKKLVEMTPDFVSILATMLVGALSCGGIALAVLYFRRSVTSPSEEPLLV